MQYILNIESLQLNTNGMYTNARIHYVMTDLAF